MVEVSFLGQFTKEQSRTRDPHLILQYNNKLIILVLELISQQNRLLSFAKHDFWRKLFTFQSFSILDNSAIKDIIIYLTSRNEIENVVTLEKIVGWNLFIFLVAKLFYWPTVPFSSSYFPSWIINVVQSNN